MKMVAVRVVICAFGFVLVVAPVETVLASGSTRPGAPITVVPASAMSPAVEPDDLPDPQLEVVRQRPKIEMPALPGFDQVPAPKQPRLEISLDVVAATPMRAFVDRDTRNRSVEHLNACNRAMVAHSYNEALDECRQALQIWDGNHLAWYAQAGAMLAKREWAEALAAAERAVTLRPDLAMYQLYYGIALYEAGRRQIDIALPHDAAEPVETGVPETPAVATSDGTPLDRLRRKLETSRDALTIALHRNPELWRAHYYLGHVYRELRDPKRAASELALTIQYNPSYRLAYVALFELYQRWGYLGHADALAALGTSYLPIGDSADLWFEIGLAYELAAGDERARQSEDRARVADARALDSYGKTLALSPTHGGARIQRALYALRRGDVVAGRRTLDEVARSSDPRRDLAIRVLEELTRIEGSGAARRGMNCRHQRNGIACRAR